MMNQQLVWPALLVVLLAASDVSGVTHQTPEFSEVHTGSVLPYRVELRAATFGAAEMPTLHSYAAAVHDGKWVLIAGRTNGLHGFSQMMAGQNFPAAYRSYDVWVIDPVAGQSWNRSLATDPASGLTLTEAISIGTTNNQFVQLGDRLYLTGGYTGQGTVDLLTAIDIPGILDWVQTGTTLASDHIRQVQDPLFAVTGGAMHAVDGAVQLVFGQDFVGAYRPGKEGNYTQQVRSFEIVDDGTTLSFTGVSSTPAVDAYRRRDLNVFPVLRSDAVGTREEGLVALAGVFTADDGVWTVPVEIDATGRPTMADPTAITTFKQGMNQYHSAKFGLYSETQRAMHEVLMGGITIQSFDESTGVLVQDDAAPNTSQITAVRINAEGEYSQHLVGKFPGLTDEAGNALRFGANAEFFRAEGVPVFSNGVIDIDQLAAGETVIGHVFGGLVANAPHVREVQGAVSAASDRVFEVVLELQAGDYSRDGVVDAADFGLWRDQFGERVVVGSYADGDGSGIIDLADYAVWSGNFGSVLTQPAASSLGITVPEPTWLLFELSLAFLLGISGNLRSVKSRHGVARGV